MLSGHRAARLRQPSVPDGPKTKRTHRAIAREGTYLADIDLVVVFDRLDAALRESFTVDGVQIE